MVVAIETLVDMPRDGTSEGTCQWSPGHDTCRDEVVWRMGHWHVLCGAGDLESIVENIVLERIDFVKERGMGAMGPLMGVVMGACPGVDGKEVSTVLRAMIQRHS